MQADPIGYAIMGAVYGVPLAWLYFLVRRNAHPTRSKLVAYLAALGLMLCLVVLGIAATLLITALAGYDVRRVPSNDPIAKAIIGLGIGAILGGIVGGWVAARGWMSKPRRG